MSSINIKQHDISDCGAACLASISAHYNLFIPIAKIRQYASTNKKGTNILGITEAAKKLNFDAKGVKGTLESLYNIPLPAIGHIIVDQKLHHFVVIYKIDKHYIWIMDPAKGKTDKIDIKVFENEWTGVLVLILPSDNFIEKNEKVSVYKRFWELVRPHKKILIQALFGALLYTIIGLSTSIYIEKLTDYVIPNGNKNLLNLLSLGFLILTLLQIFFGSVKSVFTLKTGQHIDARLILGYYKHLLTLPQSFFNTMRVGEIISRINDAVKIRKFINDVSIELILNIFIVIFSFVLMFIYSWKLALIIFISVPIYAVFYYLINKRNKTTERKVMENTALLEANLVESLGSIYTIKSLGIESHINIKTEIRFISLLKSIYKSSTNLIFSQFSTEALSKIFVVILFWYGSYFVIDNELTLGALFSFYALIGYFNQPISSLVKMNSTVQNALIAADRLFEIMDLEREAHTERRIGIKENLEGNIILKDIQFKYGNGENILSNFCLEIEKGSLNVLTGESGSGKSTVISLIQNIYFPQRGKISIGLINLNHIELKDLRNHISAIPQQIDLFKGTILENIAVGDYEPNVKRILKIANDFGINNFIDDLPNGLETFVEEKGINLSGGQKQKIGILRALYNNPEIILLDESTSALDTKSENKILLELKRLANQGKTILFVSHRQSVMKLADKLTFLKDKKINCTGKYTDLINSQNEFKEFMEEI